MIANPRIGAVTVTGSERAGVGVAVAAGQAVKKSVLELGGSDPFIVLADADLPRTAMLAAKARFLNAGQSCISAKRSIVEQPVAEEFTRLFVQAVEALVVGDPEVDGVEVGRMARADLVDGIDEQVQQSVAAGVIATCLTLTQCETQGRSPADAGRGALPARAPDRALTDRPRASGPGLPRFGGSRGGAPDRCGGQARDHGSDPRGWVIADRAGPDRRGRGRRRGQRIGHRGRRQGAPDMIVAVCSDDDHPGDQAVDGAGRRVAG